MFLDAHYLNHGANLELSLKTPSHGDAHGLVAVLGGGRGCVLRVSGLAAAIWIPLRGRLQMDATNADSIAMPGEMRVTEPEPRIHAIGRGNALWLGLFGHPHAWRRALGGLIELPTPEPVLLPARHRADNALRRRAIAIARADEQSRSDKALTLIESVAEQQAAFAPAIARCPGRTFAQRRQVFLRLQRVRNYLASNCHLDIDNESLARMASYSPWHFIRAFRAAYQETPHAYLVRMRLERARRLLSQSPLAIAEIALASGFENRCAFSRLFRERFGVTAGAVRRGDSVNPLIGDSAVGF
jgi:AraC family transcriptional regulator